MSLRPAWGVLCQNKKRKERIKTKTKTKQKAGKWQRYTYFKLIFSTRSLSHMFYVADQLEAEQKSVVHGTCSTFS
jgi:hypothetical protein